MWKKFLSLRGVEAIKLVEEFFRNQGVKFESDHIMVDNKIKVAVYKTMSGNIIVQYYSNGCYVEIPRIYMRLIEELEKYVVDKKIVERSSDKYFKAIAELKTMIWNFKNLSLILLSESIFMLLIIPFLTSLSIEKNKLILILIFSNLIPLIPIMKRYPNIMQPPALAYYYYLKIKEKTKEIHSLEISVREKIGLPQIPKKAIYYLVIGIILWIIVIIITVNIMLSIF